MGKKRSEPIIHIKGPTLGVDVATGAPTVAVKPFRESAALPMIQEVRDRLQGLEAKAIQLEGQLDVMERRIAELEVQ
jgi:hypothetical protein